ncbi:MAG: hypothetical protein GY915_02555 [bacterium]|nr:hypothetical protein [bacterium]
MLQKILLSFLMLSLSILGEEAQASGSEIGRLDHCFEEKNPPSLSPFSLQPFVEEQVYKTVRSVMTPLGVYEDDILDFVADRLLEEWKNKEHRCTIQYLSMKIPLHTVLSFDQWERLLDPQIIEALNIYNPGVNPYEREFPSGLIESVSRDIENGKDLHEIV